MKKLKLLMCLIVLSTKIFAQCADVIQPFVECDKGVYTFYFSIKNNTTWPMKGLTVANQLPNIYAVSSLFNGGKPFFNIPDIAPGATATYSVPLYVAAYSSTACLAFTFCNLDSPTVTPPPFIQCCTVDSICVDIPLCPGGPGGPGGDHCIDCDSLVELEYKPQDSLKNDCCYTLSFNNNYLPANIGTISFTGVAGTQFSTTTTGTGWAYIGTPSSTHQVISALPTGVGAGFYANFMNLCITSSTASPYKVAIRYTDVNGQCVCDDTLVFEQCDLVISNCAAIVGDSMYCKDNKTFIDFYIINTGTFPIQEVITNVTPTTNFSVTPSSVTFPNPNAINPGDTSGKITVQIDTINGGEAQFCLRVSTFDSIHSNTTFPTTCCTDSVKLCLPFINCVKTGCCEFDEMKIPNGITPNGDTKNDLWIINKPATCDSIDIVIMNRWGNKVYENKNYINTWGGTNQSGTLLPQGTYFAIITLKNGSRKGLYVDVRY